MAEAEAAAAAAAEAQHSSGGGGGTVPSTVLTLTPSGISKAVAQLIKLARRNGLERATHPDDPARFVGSEVGLHGAVAALGDAAADVGLYSGLLDGAGGGGGGGGETVIHPDRKSVVAEKQ